MNQTVAIWTLIAVALFAANIPFFNDRLFALIQLRPPRPQAQRHDKSFVIRVLELLVLYGVVGLMAYFFESTIGNPFAQKWEFYAITFSLFVVLAFPGFVVRYLLRRS